MYFIFKDRFFTGIDTYIFDNTFIKLIQIGYFYPNKIPNLKGLKRINTIFFV